MPSQGADLFPRAALGPPLADLGHPRIAPYGGKPPIFSFPLAGLAHSVTIKSNVSGRTRAGNAA